jgi:dienelactone hydrolase
MGTVKLKDKYSYFTAEASLKLRKLHGFALLGAACHLIGGCQNVSERAALTAAHGGLTAELVRGQAFQHEIYFRADSVGEPLFVFIEGDGLPWRDGGMRIAEDPTPHRPLALALAAQTPGSVLYVGRPCHFQARRDTACSAALWTSERYSAAVVASMAAVVNRVSADRQSSRVIMIGYSGGGALAVLMAPSVRGAAAVVTLAANLDIDAWVRWHGYLPLRGSLSPATEPPLSDSIAQWHLVGDQDQEVPPSVSLRYLERLSPDLTWHFASFDHICCWSEQWPAISKRINAALAARVAPPNGIP